MATTREKVQPVPLWLQFVRYGVPALMIAVGLLVLVLDHDAQRGVDVGFLFIGAAIAVFLMNLLFRIGVDGERDRDDEDAARAYFDEHGFWPDEAEEAATAGARRGG